MSRASNAADVLYAVQLHDSIRAALGRSSSSTGVVRIDRSFEPQTRAAIDVLVRRGTARRPATPRVITDVVVVMDTLAPIRGISRPLFPGALTLDYLLPKRGTNEHCIVVARVDTRPARERYSVEAELKSDVANQRLMGPCAFYEAFGHPGPAVESWFRRRGAALAQASYADGSPYIWSPSSYDRDAPRPPLTSLVTVNGVACAKGDDAKCLEAIRVGERTSRTKLLLGGVATTNTFNPFTYGYHWYGETHSLGAMHWTVLADMVRTLGPERFAAFWQSDRAVPEAFQQGTGQSLADWTRAWLIRTYEAPRPSGPGLNATGLAVGLLALILGVGLATRLAIRRQVA